MVHCEFIPLIYIRTDRAASYRSTTHIHIFFGRNVSVKVESTPNSCVNFHQYPSDRIQKFNEKLITGRRQNETCLYFTKIKDRNVLKLHFKLTKKLFET